MVRRRRPPRGDRRDDVRLHQRCAGARRGRDAPPLDRDPLPRRPHRPRGAAMTEPGDRTRGFLGCPSRRSDCRILVAELSSLSGGWGLYLTGSGERVALRATLPRPGQPPGLWAREHAVPLAPGKVQALFDCCVELDVLAESALPRRPQKPDEPVIVVTLWNPTERPPVSR